ncbi:hypothetical protein PUN28_016230 [Cardiocondyla obscurior]|uniref:Nuclear RNA export factor 1 n=1 Tax=Cardiocondyla obscurior TaxID=286306 RepID=A0AAW2EWS5_9HYME
MMYQKTMQVPNTPPSVIIDTAIAIRIAMGSKMPHERSMMSNPDLWHKIKIVKGGLYDKETILRGILKAVEPHDLLPVRYQSCGENAYFVTRNCAPALEVLCKLNMIFTNTKGDANVVVITLGYTTTDILNVPIEGFLSSVLSKRYDIHEKKLDLENFHTDEDLDKHMYCPLSQLGNLNFVLKLAKSSITTIEYLNLQHNELIDISAIDNSKLLSIKYLDLRHNKMLNMSALAPVMHLPIMKLWLDGNPLCDNYSTAKQYLDSAKRYCSYLEELDGVRVEQNIPLIYKDYVRNDSSQHFMHKFVSHFFALFDQLDRNCLRGLYRNNSFYSMSFAIPHTIAQKNGLTQYTFNRNLLKKGPKKNIGIFVGQEHILMGFTKLPRSYHDKSSFTYDMIHDDGKLIVFSVSGLLKKLTSGMYVLAFNRTFVLMATLDNEYYILNDQYHIYATPAPIPPDKIKVKYCYDENDPVCFSASEKAVLITRLQQITKMNKEWCHTCLSVAQWDMRKTILTFMKDLRNSMIPDNAFNVDSK